MKGQNTCSSLTTIYAARHRAVNDRNINAAICEALASGDIDISVMFFGRCSARKSDVIFSSFITLIVDCSDNVQSTVASSHEGTGVFTVSDCVFGCLCVKKTYLFVYSDLNFTNFISFNILIFLFCI